MRVEDKFYILANRFEKKLGYYLLEFSISKPKSDKKPKFLIKWQNKLEIADTALHYMKIERKNLKGEIIKTAEIVVSYKSIFINQYTIFVLEINTGLIKFWMEGYQLWESPVTGLMSSSNDFLICNKYGLSFIPLGN